MDTRAHDSQVEMIRSQCRKTPSNPYQPLDSATKQPDGGNKFILGRSIVLLFVAVVIAFVLLRIWILTA